MGFRIAAFASLALAILASALSAGEGILRFGSGYAKPTGQLTGSGRGGGSAGAIPILVIHVNTDYRIEPQDSTVAYVGFEMPLTARFGLELSIEGLRTDLKVQATHVVQATDYSGETPRVSEPVVRMGGYSGRLTAFPLTVGLNYRPSRSDRADLYFGPLVGWAFARDAEYDTRFGLERVNLEGGFAYGAAVGLDVPLASGPWTFNFALRYLEIEFRQDWVARVLLDRYQLPTGNGDPNDLGVDPWVARFGVGRSFGRAE